MMVGKVHNSEFRTSMENSTPFLLLILLFLSALISSSSQRTMTPPKINVWPLPSTVSWPLPIVAPLSPSFFIFSPYTSRLSLGRAVARYSSLLRSERHRPLRPLAVDAYAPPLLSLNITIADPSAPLDISTNESYTLRIPADSPYAILSAATPWGAIRGLETFSQMAWVAGEDSSAPVVVPVGVNIEDRPLFPHRGVLLDTSRNFFPVKDIMRTIKAMGHNKLNVFHWHITDSQSFPLKLPSEPELALRGSYGASLRYSVYDVHRIVQYAMSYGIRVIPEIDAPGHTASWGEAYPEIVTCANKFWNPKKGPQLAAEPGTGQLNPLNSKTYEVIRNVLGDVAKLFPDKFLHGGADEVNKACWEEDETIKNFVNSGGTHDQLLEIFINTTHPFMTSTLNRTAVYWEDVLLGPNVAVLNPSTTLPKATTVLQTWNNGLENTKRLVSLGYRVIVSSWKYYYLDCGFGTWLGNDVDGGSWCEPYKSWQQVYDYDIVDGLSDEERKLVLGGEVALWSELADETVLDSRLWPRSAAAAEALWSGNKRNDSLTERMNEWRYRMVKRGIGAAPIQPLWCVMHDGMCNLDE